MKSELKRLFSELHKKIACHTPLQRHTLHLQVREPSGGRTVPFVYRYEETEAAADFRFSILIFGELAPIPGA